MTDPKDTVELFEALRADEIAPRVQHNTLVTASGEGSTCNNES